MQRARYLIVIALVFSSIICRKGISQPVTCNSNYFLNAYPDNDSSFLIYDMAFTQDDDVIVTGTITKRSIFPTEMHGVIFRVDKNGNKLWELYLSGAGRIYCRRIIRLQDNHFLLAGFDQSGPADFLMKVTLDGTVLWRKNILKTQSFGSGFNGLKETPDGSVILASDLDEGPDSKGLLMSKFDKNGNLLFSAFHRLNGSNLEMAVRDMVTIGSNSYIVGLLRKNINQQKIHTGFLISINNGTGNLQWARLYDLNGSDQDFFQVFGYSGGKLCILGRNPVSSENVTNLMICDTSGNIENNNLIRFGQKSEFSGVAAMDNSGNILYGNENKQAGSTDLSMMLINPYTGIQWSRHYPSLNAYPYLNKLLYSKDDDIYAGGRIFSSGVFSFIGKFSSDGEMKCGSAGLTVDFEKALSGISTIDFAQVSRSFTMADGKYPPVSDQVKKGKELCQPAGACSFFNLSPLNTVCKNSDILQIAIGRNADCAGEPVFTYNADSITLIRIGNDTAEFIVHKTGTIVIRASVRGICDILYDTLTINTGKLSGNIFQSADTLLCDGATMLLDAGNAYNTYLWQDGSIESGIQIDRAGLYYVETTDNCGFTYTDSIVVVASPPVVFDLGPDRELCGNGTVTIAAPSGYSEYIWSNNSNGQALTVTNPGSYWLRVADENHCYGTDTVHVSAKDCKTSIYVPNAFTPNNDGLNDDFKPTLIGVVTQYRFTVYNRWGQIVFVSADPDNGWDGMYKGKKAEGNVFTWTCLYELEGSAKKIDKGQVYLIR